MQPRRSLPTWRVTPHVIGGRPFRSIREAAVTLPVLVPADLCTLTVTGRGAPRVAGAGQGGPDPARRLAAAPETAVPSGAGQATIDPPAGCRGSRPVTAPGALSSPRTAARQPLVTEMAVAR
jgi:hypothetical protein